MHLKQVEKFFKSFVFLILVGAFAAIIIGGSIGFLTKPSSQNKRPLTLIHPLPNLSAWIAWWEEDKAYALLDEHPNAIKTISPVWFMLDKRFNLETIGSVNKSDAVTNAHAKGIRVIPSLGSELSSQEFSQFLKNTSKKELLVRSLIDTLTLLDVDGLDIDLEGTHLSTKNEFTQFITYFSSELHKKNFIVTIAVHAQNGTHVWEGTQGQDLKKIGEAVDEVRIMIYDEHSASSPPGSISSYSWISNVLTYNQKLIPKDKITVGIPSYGYIWPKTNDPKGLQFYEFHNYLETHPYTSKKRDSSSGEVIFSGKDFTGYLSDSYAMKKKIKVAQDLGFNKFIIWHLGGLDEGIFTKDLTRL